MLETRRLQYWTSSLFVAAIAGGCIAGNGQSSSAIDWTGESCQTIDFDTDGNGDPIVTGEVIEEAYAAKGIHVQVFQDEAETIPGLGVAFDSKHPTGGDDDLKFSGLGHILINQEHFTAADVAAGKVAEPDDEAKGAFFDIRFDDPACVRSLILLDIDYGEDPAKLAFYDSADNLITTHQVAPMGNNVRLDVPLPSTPQCNVARMTVYLSSSGAMDNLEVCRRPQAPQVWTRTYDSGYDDVGNDVAADSRRNAVVVGTSGTAAGTTDGIVRKYDPDGNLLWATSIDNGGDDTAESDAIDTCDDILVAGRTAGASDDDLYVTKLKKDGSTIWTKTYDGGGDDAAYGVASDSNKNIVVAGFTSVATGSDIFVRKYDRDGNTVWTRSADVGNRDMAFDVAIGPNDEIAVVGQIDNGDLDLWVRLYDAGGTEQWTRVFDGGGDDIGHGVAIDGDGNVLVGGEAFNGATSDVFVRKYDSDGNTVWTQTYDGGGVDVGNGVATDASGSVIVNGFTDNATRDGWTRKYDADGNEVWTELFDQGGADEGNGVATDTAGAVLATGFFEGPNDLDLWLARYRP